MADALRLGASGLADADLVPCLPQALRDLLKLVSMRGLLALIEAFGGRRVFVPQAPKPTSPLAGVLSRKDFSALCAQYGGDIFVMPRGTALKCWIRTQKVIALRAAGVSVRNVALELEMTERNVWRIAAQHQQTLERRPPKTTPREERIAR